MALPANPISLDLESMKINPLLAIKEENTAVEEALPIIDEKIATQRSILMRLLSQRNELAPISRLPNEVLGLIFVFASATRKRDCRLSMQFNFSHVSQRWRFVALGTPEIWCSIPFHNQGWAPLVLERSKSTDLLVDATLAIAPCNSPFVLLIKEVLKRHTPRIRELSFTEISSATFSLLLGDTKPSSLRLRSLCLQSLAYEKELCFSMGNLMNPEILQNLDVKRVDVDWFRLPLTSLVSLKIHDPPNRPSWTDFVTALQAMPALENLDLENSLPVATEVRRRPLNPVGLTRLRKLSLDSWTGINEVLNVLSFIVVRQTTMLNLGVHVYRQIHINSVPPNLAPSLSAFLSEMRSEHYEKLFYQTLRVFCTPAMLDLMAWGEGCENGFFPEDPVNLTLSIYFHYTGSDAGAKGLQGVLPFLPVVKLVTLALDIDVTVEQNLLVATFGNLPQLRNVSITGTGTSNLLFALLHKPDNYNTCASAYYSTSFPALRSIEFRGVIFTPDTASHLEDCLMERWERNAEIRKLIFSDCSSLYTYDVQRLREIVVNVDWDGLEHEYQSDDDDDDDDGDDD